MKTKRFKLEEPGTLEVIMPLENPGEEVEVLGLVNARMPGDYVVKVVSDHIGKNTFGRVVIKGVAENGARVKIDGMVKVEKQASKTDSFLEMRVLLLDKKSWAVAEPKLEIESNDVKASHAATVGRIDEALLFYLVSRGVEKNKAQQLIVDGFLKEVAEEVTQPTGELKYRHDERD